MAGCKKPIILRPCVHVQTGQSEHHSSILSSMTSVKSDAQTNPVINITLPKSCQAKKIL